MNNLSEIKGKEKKKKIKKKKTVKIESNKKKVTEKQDKQKLKKIRNNTPNKIINIKTKNHKIKSDKGYFESSFYFNNFFDGKKVNTFIKNIEKMVRNSDEYSRYIVYLKNEIGLDYCMLLPNINDDKAKIEMHHGPILNLYDYCEIIINSMEKRKEKITSFKISNLVLKAHFDNIVQVVMLSKTTHELVHAGKIFIHPSQAWGDLNSFLNLYQDGLTKEQILTINNYIELAKKQESTDNEFLKFNSIKKWRDNNDFSINF